MDTIAKSLLPLAFCNYLPLYVTNVAQAIKEIGYNGPLVIESFTPKVKSIARAAAIWRPLADSPEALAGEGYKFLKALLG